MTDTPRILIVDDDVELAEMLCEYLAQQGLAARAVHDGRAMDQALARDGADLIVLDLMLPGEDGLAIARRLGGQLPIVMLSARGEETDRIVGLELGADDYLPKPFNPRELVARIRAVLRRGQPVPATPQSIRFGPYLLDLDSHSLRCGTAPIALTTAEFTLLKLLALNPNRVLSRDQLMDLASGTDRMPFDRSIDVRVARLRRKLGDDPNNPSYIRTVWGSGYLFTPSGNPP